MPFGQEAVYSVEHGMGWKIEHFRIPMRLFDRAQAGYLLSQGWICDKFQERVQEEFGINPGMINYQDLVFMRRRVVPRRAARPPKMKAVTQSRVRSRFKVLNSRR
jgi:hypothetical protein